MSLFSEPPTLTDSYLLQLFNLHHESVESISITRQSDAVYAHIKLQSKPHLCPICGDSTSTIKDYTTKKIIHSLITNTPCLILYKARRYICKSCGKSFYEHNPFVHHNMKISALTVSNVLRDLKLPNETFTSVASRYHISNTTVASIFDHHVSIPRRMLPRFLTIDEVYAFHDNRSNYVCVLVDGISKHTVDLLPSRKKEDLLRYFSLIPLEERKKVKIVCIDMWDTYRMVCRSVFPNCLVSVDKFHLIQDLNRRVDKIRISTMNKVKPTSDKRKKEMSIEERYHFDVQDKQYYLLKKFYWLLYQNPNKLYEKNEYGELINKLDPNYKKRYNHKFKQWLNLYDIQQLLLEINPALDSAFDLKIRFTDFYETSTFEEAKDHLTSLIYDFSSCRIPELVAFSNTLKRWKREIINSFIIIDEATKARPTSAIAENRNKVIKQLKHNSNGYKNWHRFKNRVLYVTNDDATYSLNPRRDE